MAEHKNADYRSAGIRMICSQIDSSNIAWSPIPYTGSAGFVTRTESLNMAFKTACLMLRDYGTGTNDAV